MHRYRLPPPPKFAVYLAYIQIRPCKRSLIELHVKITRPSLACTLEPNTEASSVRVFCGHAAAACHFPSAICQTFPRRFTITDRRFSPEVAFYMALQIAPRFRACRLICDNPGLPMTDLSRPALNGERFSSPRRFSADSYIRRIYVIRDRPRTGKNLKSRANHAHARPVTQPRESRCPPCFLSTVKIRAADRSNGDAIARL